MGVLKTLKPICFCISKVFLKKIIFFIFFFASNSYFFDVFISF